MELRYNPETEREGEGRGERRRRHLNGLGMTCRLDGRF